MKKAFLSGLQNKISCPGHKTDKVKFQFGANSIDRKGELVLFKSAFISL